MDRFKNGDLGPNEDNGLNYGSDPRFFAAAGGIQQEPFKYPPKESAPGEAPLQQMPSMEETPREPVSQTPAEPISQEPVFQVPANHMPEFREATAFENRDSATMDGTYHAAGVGRRETTCDTYAWPASQAAPQLEPVETPQAPKKKRRTKKRRLGAVAAVAAVCALVGSLGGGAAVGYYMHRQNQKTTAQLQSQIDALKGQDSSSVVISSSSTPVVNTSGEDGLLNPALVYEQNAKSVVSVITTGIASNGWTTREYTSSGSGFILTQDGYVLTNYHVIEGYQSVSVTAYDGTEHDAVVVGYDSLSDVALLKVEAEDLPAVTVGDSDVLAVGDQVVAIGNPLGELASTQTVGYVSAKDRMVNTDGTILNMIQTDAAINSGNSGGPLFNMYGQVIGITTAKYSGSSSSGATIEGIGFAIPINSVMDLVSDLIEYGYITGQAFLGITLDKEEIDPTIAAYYGLPSGPRVSTVVEGSCADNAGIQPGDFIIGVGNVKIASYSDLTYALRSYKAGDSTTVTVFRAGAELTLDVVFDEKPADTSVSQDQSPEESAPTSPNGSGD